MKILITGGAGYIGSHIAEEFSKNNQVIIVDNLSTGYQKLLFKKIKFYKLDIRKTTELKKIIIKERINIVVHLAAKLSLQEAQKKPKQYFSNNVNGTKSVLKAIHNSYVKTIIFSSTAAVYSGNKEIACKENLKPKPINLYGKTKLISEELIKKFCKKNKIKSIILRYFNVVGASKSGKIGSIKNYGQLFKILSKSVIKKKPKINVYGNDHKTPDGTCVRDFIDINDIVSIHSLIINKKEKIKNGTIINCGYGKGFSILDVISSFEKVARKKIKIKFLKKRYKEISNIYADNTLIKDILKWKPKYKDLRVSIKRCLNWEKKLKNVQR